MVISKEEDNLIYIKADGDHLEQVDHFKYLGQTITPDGKNEKEITQQRIAISKSRFQQMYNVHTIYSETTVPQTSSQTSRLLCSFITPVRM